MESVSTPSSDPFEPVHHGPRGSFQSAPGVPESGTAPTADLFDPRYEGLQGEYHFFFRGEDLALSPIHAYNLSASCRRHQ